MDTKIIGYFGAGSDYEYQGKLIDGMHEACRNEKIRIEGFTSLYNKQPEWLESRLLEVVYAGENRIFSLANFERMDGVVILADMFSDAQIQHKIAAAATAAGLPVMIIDGEEPGCYSIFYNDEHSMGAMVDHVIEQHGAGKINFLSGYRENRQSEERVAAYKKSLQAHGILFEPARVGYGEFGTRTREALTEFIQNGVADADAIVCANDMMAFQTIRFLSERGKNVPDDIIVTGFDGIAMGQKFCPALTSVRRAIYEAGVKAVRLLQDYWQGKEIPPATWLDSVVIRNQSCGCLAVKRTDIADHFETQVSHLNDYKRQNYDLVNFGNELAGAKSFEEIILCLRNNFYLYDIRNMYICLNDGLIQEPEGILNTENACRKDYTQEMTAYYFLADGNIVSERFLRRDILPEACRNNQTFRHAYCIPLYYQDRNLGYLITKYERYDQKTDLLYTFLRTFCNAVGEYCMRIELESVVSKLAYLNVRDPLTGLYNRRGLTGQSAKMIERARENGEWVIGIGIDLDDLKKINDTYGHDEGDHAIVKIADAARSARQGNMLLCRTGGDEFFIFFTSADPGGKQTAIEQIHAYLANYNRNSEKPYRVECSCGGVVKAADEAADLEYIMQAADRVMYAVKTEKKARRMRNGNTEKQP